MCTPVVTAKFFARFRSISDSIIHLLCSSSTVAYMGWLGDRLQIQKRSLVPLNPNPASMMTAPPMLNQIIKFFKSRSPSLLSYVFRCVSNWGASDDNLRIKVRAWRETMSLNALTAPRFRCWLRSRLWRCISGQYPRIPSDQSNLPLRFWLSSIYSESKGDYYHFDRSVIVGLLEYIAPLLTNRSSTASRELSISMFLWRILRPTRSPTIHFTNLLENIQRQLTICFLPFAKHLIGIICRHVEHAANQRISFGSWWK